jgi:hypothetical protein
MQGPMVIELPPGPLLAVLMDLNQRYILDMGLPGPDAGTAVGTWWCRLTAPGSQATSNR